MSLWGFGNKVAISWEKDHRSYTCITLRAGSYRRLGSYSESLRLPYRVTMSVTTTLQFTLAKDFSLIFTFRTWAHGQRPACSYQFHVQVERSQTKQVGDKMNSFHSKLNRRPGSLQITYITLGPFNQVYFVRADTSDMSVHLGHGCLTS